MAKKKFVKKKKVSGKKSMKKKFVKHKSNKKGKKKLSKKDVKQFPTLNLKTESEIGMDFATKVHKKFDSVVKATILFGSEAKNEAKSTSDIDVIIVIVNLL